MTAATLAGPIRTGNLELVTLTERFVHALLEGDRIAASFEVGARVGTWLTADPSHVIQLHLAAQAAEARGYPGLGRAIVFAPPGSRRRVIGSVGFHGPPDDLGRLEASCRVHPEYRSAGFLDEALAGLLAWCTIRYAITRFLVAVASSGEDVDRSRLGALRSRVQVARSPLRDTGGGHRPAT